MSQSLFEHVAADQHTAISAGTTPPSACTPEVVAVMHELGIDLAERMPNSSRANSPNKPTW